MLSHYNSLLNGKTLEVPLIISPKSNEFVEYLNLDLVPIFLL